MVERINRDFDLGIDFGLGFEDFCGSGILDSQRFNDTYPDAGRQGVGGKVLVSVF